MPFWKIVDRSNQSIISQYETPDSTQIQFGGPWGDLTKVAHLMVPADAMPNGVRVSLNEEGELSLVPDVELIAAAKREENLNAKNQFIAQHNIQAEQSISALLGGHEKVTHLMRAIDKLEVVVRAAVTALGATDAQLEAAVPGATEARGVLASYRVGLLDPVNQIMADRDAEIASFAPPFTDVAPLYPTM